MNLRSNIVVQIGIIVKDINKSAKQLADFLGVEVPPIFESNPENQKYHGKPSSGKVKQVLFNLHNTQIEMLEPIGEGDTAWHESLEKYGEGPHHIAFRCEDVDEEIKRCEGLGMITSQTGESPRAKYVYMDDMENSKMFYEILQFKTDDNPMEKLFHMKEVKD